MNFQNAALSMGISKKLELRPETFGGIQGPTLWWNLDPKDGTWDLRSGILFVYGSRDPEIRNRNTGTKTLSLGGPQKQYPNQNLKRELTTWIFSRRTRCSRFGIPKISFTWCQDSRFEFCGLKKCVKWKLRTGN